MAWAPTWEDQSSAACTFKCQQWTLMLESSPSACALRSQIGLQTLSLYKAVIATTFTCTAVTVPSWDVHPTRRANPATTIASFILMARAKTMDDRKRQLVLALHLEQRTRRLGNYLSPLPMPKTTSLFDRTNERNSLPPSLDWSPFKRILIRWTGK